MSGIFGVIRLPGVMVTDGDMAPMAEVLKHRGPDGIQYVARENAGLGHCMLHTTPESLGEILPFRDEDSGLSITADARIDNREQLMADIPVHPENGKVLSDSELVLHAYLKWGESCVDYLLGDFVFAIWDEKVASLFVARDQMGCKPFYYYCGDDYFVFASSASAVARMPDIEPRLNKGRLADWLVQELEGINKTCSWFDQITRMPPAHSGLYDGNRFVTKQYWVLQPADLSHLKTDADFLEAFSKLYKEAVICRLRSASEPASMLSGGIDSSTVVAISREFLLSVGKPFLRTYSAISSEEGDCHETSSIRKVIAQGNLTATCVSPLDIGKHSGAYDRAMESLEDPFDISWDLLGTMFLRAGEDGSRVILDGLDGDLVLGVPAGYPVELLRQGMWRSAWREVKGYTQHYYEGKSSAVFMYFFAIRALITPDWLRKIRGSFGVLFRSRALITESWITQDFSREIDLVKRNKEYERSLSATDRGFSPWCRHVLQVPYLVAAIERYERLGSYYGLESRHPLLDIRLLEFAAALPLRQRVRGGWTKFLLRGLGGLLLPQAVAWREGHIQLGWVFSQQRASQGGWDGVPIDNMKCLLTPYVKAGLWDTFGGAGNAEAQPENQLVERDFHQFYKWMRKNFGTGTQS